MENERDTEKFNIEYAYTVAEFVEICRNLASDPTLQSSTVGYLLRWIEWAERGSSDALIRWEYGPDNTLHPYRVISVAIDSASGEVEVG